MYYQKYVKYKEKYLRLRNEMEGGGLHPKTWKWPSWLSRKKTTQNHETPKQSQKQSHPEQSHPEQCYCKTHNNETHCKIPCNVFNYLKNIIKMNTIDKTVKDKLDNFDSRFLGSLNPKIIIKSLYDIATRCSVDVNNNIINLPTEEVSKKYIIKLIHDIFNVEISNKYVFMCGNNDANIDIKKIKYIIYINALNNNFEEFKTKVQELFEPSDIKPSKQPCNISSLNNIFEILKYNLTTIKLNETCDNNVDKNKKIDTIKKNINKELEDIKNIINIELHTN